MKSKSLLTAVSLVACSATSQAAVVVNDAMVSDGFYFSGHPDVYQYLHLTTTLSSTSGVINRVTDLGGGSFRFNPLGLAERYSFFQVAEGIAFNAVFVSANTPFFANFGLSRSGTLSLALGQSALLAYWDDRQKFPSTGLADDDDNYGWVRLTRIETGLTASSGATASGGGIIVGTTTQIPEPSPVALFMISVGGIAVGFRRRPR